MPRNFHVEPRGKKEYWKSCIAEPTLPHAQVCLLLLGTAGLLNMHFVHRSKATTGDLALLSAWIYRSEAAPLALSASQRAVALAAVPLDAITHLVSVSCTGFYAPGFDIELVRQLPLSPTVQRTHVGFMGCHGAMNGLRVASAIVNSDPDAIVLLCAAELCSLHFQYGWSTSNLVANSLFPDGAAALIVRSQSRSREIACFQHVSSASFIVPDSAAAIMWRVGDHGFNMSLSPRVPDVVREWLPEWLNGWLLKHALQKRDIAGWAVHPGGPRILDAVQECLELPDDALQHSRTILSECGNMSSPTVLFILERMLSSAVQGNCVVLGFGTVSSFGRGALLCR